jgi:hypothetical protein
MSEDNGSKTTVRWIGGNAAQKNAMYAMNPEDAGMAFPALHVVKEAPVVETSSGVKATDLEGWRYDNGFRPTWKWDDQPIRLTYDDLWTRVKKKISVRAMAKSRAMIEGHPGAYYCTGLILDVSGHSVLRSHSRRGFQQSDEWNRDMEQSCRDYYSRYLGQTCWIKRKETDRPIRQNGSLRYDWEATWSETIDVELANAQPGTMSKTTLDVRRGYVADEARRKKERWDMENKKYARNGAWKGASRPR